MVHILAGNFKNSFKVNKIRILIQVMSMVVQIHGANTSGGGQISIVCAKNKCTDRKARNTLLTGIAKLLVKRSTLLYYQNE